MDDLVARALGKAALRKVAPEQKEQLLNLRRDRAKELAAEGITLHKAALSEAICTVDIAAMQSMEHEQKWAPVAVRWAGWLLRPICWPMTGTSWGERMR